MVDLLPTVAGLLGVDPPADVHLDGTDLTPLLTDRREEFSRSQPLFWFSPDAGAAIRDGKYSLVAWGLSRPQRRRTAASATTGDHKGRPYAASSDADP